MRAVSVRARSFDPAKRTFEFVLASETPCLTYRLDRNWNLIEVEEVLPMSALVGLENFRGCPLLDSHMSWSVRDVLGRITGLRTQATQLIGSAFLSDREDVAGVARDLETGVLGEFSVGFDVLEDGEIEERPGQLPLIRVKSWGVREGSLVPIPADVTATMRGARQRSAATLPSRKPTIGTRKMTNEQLAALIAGYRSSSAALMTGLETLLVASGDPAGAPADLEAEADAAAEEARAAFIAARAAGTQSAPVQAPAAPAAGQRSEADQKAIAGLKIVCGKRGLAEEFDAMEKAGASLAELRGILGTGLRTSGATVQTVTLTPAGDAKRGKLNGFGESEIGKQRMAAK